MLVATTKPKIDSFHPDPDSYRCLLASELELPIADSKSSYVFVRPNNPDYLLGSF